MELNFHFFILYHAYMKIRYINKKQLDYVIPNYFYGEEYEVEEIYTDKISIITDVDNYYNDINIDFSKGEESLTEYKRITDLYTKDIDVKFIKIKGIIRPDSFLVTTNKEIRRKYRIKNKKVTLLYLYQKYRIFSV